MIVADVATVGKKLALDVVIGKSLDVLLKSQPLHLRMLWMQSVVAGKVVSRHDRLDGVAEKGEVSGRLREMSVDAKGMWPLKAFIWRRLSVGHRSNRR